MKQNSARKDLQISKSSSLEKTISMYFRCFRELSFELLEAEIPPPLLWSCNGCSSILKERAYWEDGSFNILAALLLLCWEYLSSAAPGEGCTCATSGDAMNFTSHRFTSSQHRSGSDSWDLTDSYLGGTAYTPNSAPCRGSALFWKTKHLSTQPTEL